LTSNFQCGPGESIMKKLWQLLIRSNKKTCAAHPTQQASEKGQSLPAALIALAVGALLLTPFLGFVSSRTLGTGTAEETFNELYAADAGIEYAIWSLLNVPSFRTQVDLNAGTAQALSFPGSINGLTPTVSVTGLPTGIWYTRADAPGTVNRGGGMAYAGGDRVYALRGDGSRDFDYYSISANQWYSLANTPRKVARGGSLVYGGGNYLYALRGNNQDDFWRYNISTNSWSSRENTPSKVRQGGALAYDGGNNIYAFRGNSTDFWRYDISSDSWSSRADAPANVGDGADLVYTGGNTIYALRGRKNTDFWRYDTSSNNWSTRQDTPANIDDGGALAYYGGNYIYALQGKDTGFFRYAVTMDNWTALTDTPGTVGFGGDLIFTYSEGGFAMRGNDQSDFWEFKVIPPRYDIAVQAGSVSTNARIEIDGGTRTILFWDID